METITTVKLTGPEGIKRREFVKLGKESMQAVGLRHRRLNLHHHFEKRAFSRYGYARRRGDFNPRVGGTYSSRKLKLFGHIKPLVFTGELRRLTLNGVRLVKAIARNAGELVARMPMPRKANLKNPYSTIHPLKELQLFAAVEIADLDKFLAEDFDRRYSRKP